jgi:hypothetical protein
MLPMAEEDLLFNCEPSNGGDSRTKDKHVGLSPIERKRKKKKWRKGKVEAR